MVHKALYKCCSVELNSKARILYKKRVTENDLWLGGSQGETRLRAPEAGGRLALGEAVLGLGQRGGMSRVREEGVKEGGVPYLARVGLSLR